VTLRDTAAFKDLYNAARSSALERRKRNAEHELRQPGCSGRCNKVRRELEAISRLSKIWNPFGKRLPIYAIRVDDKLITNESDRLDALARAWAPTFAHEKPMNTALAEMIAKELASKYDMINFAPPSSSLIGLSLSRVRNTSPGIDGIPYRAWLYAGRSAWRLLHQVACWLCSGFQMMHDFNDTLMIFAPKGSERDDDAGVVREPMTTRPLGIKNTDVRNISAAINFVIREATGKHASRIQRGFVYGRNFLDNVVDLDTYARNIFFTTLALAPDLSVHRLRSSPPIDYPPVAFQSDRAFRLPRRPYQFQ
jgi:hypothetical protein